MFFRTAVFLATTALTPQILAADILRVPLAPAEVTVYPQGAMVGLRADLDVPAGQHTLRMPLNPQLAQGGFGFTLDLRGDVTLMSRSVSRVPFDPKLYYTDAQTEADAALTEAETATRIAQDAVAQSRSQIAALEAQVAFLRTATASNAETLPSVLQLTELGGAIGAEVARLSAERITLSAALPALEEAITLAQEAETRARAALDNLTPPQANWTLFDLEVQAAATAPVQANVTLLTGAASWRTTYEVDLTEGALTLEPSAQVQNNSGQSWDNVALTLSTVFPFDRIDGPYVGPQIASIFDPEARQQAFDKSNRGLAMSDSMASPMMEAEVVVQSAPMQVSGRQDGPAFVFDVPGSVSVLNGASQAEFALETISLEAETQIFAAPRIEKKAFLIASTTNTGAGPILAGEARFSRDGVFIGQSNVPEMTPGAEADLPFGALKGIQLARRVLDRQSGDQGIISRSDTREEVVEFDVTNLTNEAQEVRTLYAFPVSEQEDLEINVSAQPVPTTFPYDDRRGVAAWDFALKPGEKRTVRIDMALRWPEGQLLNWRP